LEPAGGLAFIGRNPKDKRRNIFIATGTSGNGMTYGTIAGILLTDLILGRKNEWAKIYDPARRIKKNLQAAPCRQAMAKRRRARKRRRKQ
jgi:glycine/D-amino acid oxidase-like deaminating enzyme